MSYLITYTDTSHMYSGSRLQTLHTNRKRSWIIFELKDFLTRFSISDRISRVTHTIDWLCLRSHVQWPTQALANGKYVVSCRSSSSSPTLLAKQCFLLSCGRRCDDSTCVDRDALENFNLYCCDNRIRSWPPASRIPRGHYSMLRISNRHFYSRLKADVVNSFFEAIKRGATLDGMLVKYFTVNSNRNRCSGKCCYQNIWRFTMTEHQTWIHVLSVNKKINIDWVKKR